MSNELAITQAIYEFFNQSNLAMESTKYLTNGFWLVLAIYFTIFALMQRRYILIGFYAVANIIGFGLKEIITLFFQRARPYEVLDLGIKANLTENSFYSTHTFVAFITCFFIFFLTDKLWIRIIAIVLATLVAFTRLILAQHYISDIIAGFLLALLLYLITKKVYEKYFEERYEK